LTRDAGKRRLASDQSNLRESPRNNSHSPDISRTNYLIAELRAASIRARLWQLDINALGIALKGGLVDPEQAIELLAERDVLHLVGTEPGEPA
jgi:hypothetical protein